MTRKLVTRDSEAVISSDSEAWRPNGAGTHWQTARRFASQGAGNTEHRQAQAQTRKRRHTLRSASDLLHSDDSDGTSPSLRAAAGPPPAHVPPPKQRGKLLGLGAAGRCNQEIRCTVLTLQARTHSPCCDVLRCCRPIAFVQAFADTPQ